MNVLQISASVMIIIVHKWFKFTCLFSTTVVCLLHSFGGLEQMILFILSFSPDYSLNHLPIPSVQMWGSLFWTVCYEEKNQRGKPNNSLCILFWLEANVNACATRTSIFPAVKTWLCILGPLSTTGCPQKTINPCFEPANQMWVS